MAIPASQLETWSRQGATVGSSTTYQSIRNALTDAKSPLKDAIASGTVRVYLQGSYAHDTNIWGDSDVDIIVELATTFHSNKLQLPTPQYIIHENTYPIAPYQWTHFRADVIKALEAYYTSSFVDTTGKKSIKVLVGGGRLKADIVPVISYRKYDYFLGEQNHQKEHGVAFYHTQTGREIINYPKQHYDNAVAKHQNTDEEYKRIVRAFKNARSYLADKGLLSKDKAPSHFVQGLVYNVPSSLFTSDIEATILAALKHLYQTDIGTFTSQNGQHALVGDSEEQWKPADTLESIRAFVHLWDNWSSI